MRLFKVLVATRLARSRTEAERLIHQGSVSVGGCEADCSFFNTGRCTCGGWQKVTNPTEEIAAGVKVKIGSGLWRLMKRLDGIEGYQQLNGIAAAPEIDATST